MAFISDKDLALCSASFIDSQVEYYAKHKGNHTRDARECASLYACYRGEQLRRRIAWLQSRGYRMSYFVLRGRSVATWHLFDITTADGYMISGNNHERLIDEAFTFHFNMNEAA